MCVCFFLLLQMLCCCVSRSLVPSLRTLETLRAHRCPPSFFSPALTLPGSSTLGLWSSSPPLLTPTMRMPPSRLFSAEKEQIEQKLLQPYTSPRHPLFFLIFFLLFFHLLFLQYGDTDGSQTKTFCLTFLVFIRPRGSYAASRAEGTIREAKISSSLLPPPSRLAMNVVHTSRAELAMSNIRIVHTCRAEFSADEDSDLPHRPLPLTRTHPTPRIHKCLGRKYQKKRTPSARAKQSRFPAQEKVKTVCVLPPISSTFRNLQASGALGSLSLSLHQSDSAGD